jgi:Zn finger protein HypA/HybF involved in hydrogenase expression
MCKCGVIYQRDFDSFKNGNHRLCKKCAREIIEQATRLKYEYIKNYIEIESNSGCKLLSKEYKNNNEELLIQCSCGNTFYRTFNNFYSGQTKCNKCSKEYAKIKRTKTNEEFELEFYNIWKDKIVLMGEYKAAREKVKVKCNTCGHIWSPSADSLLRGTGCPVCKESKGERRIRFWLECNNFNFSPQYTYDDLIGIGGRLLKFDFAILDYKNNVKLLIEYDGIQHFEWIKGMMVKKDFERLQKHDKMKDNYCKINNILLLRIPFWEFEKIEEILDKQLNSNKLGIGA